MLKLAEGFLLGASVCFLFLMLLIVGGVTSSDLEVKANEDAHYCEMVGIYRNSDGEYGWPPYNESISCE